MNRSPSSLPSPQDILNTLTHNTYKPFCLHHTTTFLLISQPPGASASIIYSCEGAGCWSSCPLFTMMSDDSQNSSGAGGRRSAGAAASAAAAMRPPEQGLKCPRCDSPNTKFCYYNNYSLSQPRHFCKTCRRYWTKGGALRNVPVGGGCRKNKKSKSPASSRLPLVDPTDPMARFPEFHGGHKFLNVSPPPLAADFHIGLLPFSRLQAPATASGIFGSNQFMSFGDISTASNAAISSSVGASITAPMLGLNYPISDLGLYNEIGRGNTGSSSSSAANGSAHSNSIVSSIESLSSINQDLHWKLQQQRMATLFGGKAQKEGSSSIQSPALGNHQEDNSSFRMAERSKDENCATGINRSHSSPAWFLEGSCTMSIATTSPPTTTNNNITSSNNNMNTSNWTGITTWNDMPQFTTL